MGLLRGLLDLLLPPACAACGRPVPDAETLCGSCAASLPRIPPEACSRCQQRPARPGAPDCGVCGLAGRPSPLVACVADVWFEGPVEAWTHRFKYPPSGLAGQGGADRALARALVCAAARRAPGPPPRCVVPVPLHPRRLRARGFNPAALLARAVARQQRVPVDPVALVRLRDTPSQTGLDRRARRANVRAAIRARRDPPECVWLVDDVVTTGATLDEAARALRRAGARRIVALCAARTPLPETRDGSGSS